LMIKLNMFAFILNAINRFNYKKGKKVFWVSLAYHPSTQKQQCNIQYARIFIT